MPRPVANKLIYQQDEHGNTPLHAAEEEGNIEFLQKLLQCEEGEQEVTVLSPAPVSSRLQNHDGNTPLHVALIKGRNLKVAELLVKHFPDLVGVINNEGNTPLHVAAALGDTDVFKTILHEVEHSQPTWMSMGNDKGNTPLHVAVINGKVEIARLLLEKDPKLASVTNKFKETPLHLALIIHQIIGLRMFFVGVEVGIESVFARYGWKWGIWRCGWKFGGGRGDAGGWVVVGAGWV
uniref:Uncharacterized protein n=1 Tax=Chenopodium quinoa TaxID=63459 RepID=A0A803MA13_CHEQI